MLSKPGEPIELLRQAPTQQQDAENGGCLFGTATVEAKGPDEVFGRRPQDESKEDKPRGKQAEWNLCDQCSKESRDDSRREHGEERPKPASDANPVVREALSHSLQRFTGDRSRRVPGLSRFAHGQGSVCNDPLGLHGSPSRSRRCATTKSATRPSARMAMPTQPPVVTRTKSRRFTAPTKKDSVPRAKRPKRRCR